MTFADREPAERVAADLREEGFATVLLDSETAAPESGWTVRVVDERLPEIRGGGAYEGLRDRFSALVQEHGGSYLEPGDPRPPVESP